MKLNLQIRIYVALFVTFLSVGTNFAQEKAFTQVPENIFTIRGNLELVGNHIVSINDDLDRDRFGNLINMRFAPNDDFNVPLTNANLVMDYVDIDGDDSTISSSSADLILPSSCGTIRYAGLYWAGTYFWKRQLYWDTDSFFDRNGNEIFFDFLTTDDTGRLAYLEPDGTIVETVTTKLAEFPDRNYGENDPSIPNPRTQNDEFDYRYIKFKPPGQPYIDITPTSTPVASQEFFDGFPRTATNPGNVSVTDVPYVGYADVTSIVAGLADPTGTYTVGNVKTFTGRTDGGGTAGGWALVITYEDPNEDRRYISSFNGYAKINAGAATPITYAYNGFQTIPNGPVNARFGVAALEGDEGFVGDALEIRADGMPGFTTIGSAPLNPPNNFFDGTVSNNGNNVITRNPMSINTLGFDLDILDINNPNNSVIGNGETGATFRTSTVGDTFGTFLNTFAIEVIEPDIQIVKRVEDVDGFPIQQGAGVVLGQELFYVLTVRNIGNDDAINTIIRDNIPLNTTFQTGTVTVPATGVTFNYDATAEQIVFNIDDELVRTRENGGGSFVLRFKVQVATSCEMLRDACSDDVRNTAEASYTGALSGIDVTDDASISEITGNECPEEGASFTNFIVDLGQCVFDFEQELCNGSADLRAGNGYVSYSWTNSVGTVVGTTQSITVTQPDVYTLEAIGGDCRDIIETHTVIPLTTNGQNPVLPFANSFSFCAIDGSIMPEIYLCGESDERLIDVTTFLNTTSLAWERLDETSCAVVEPGCPNTDNTCVWNNVGTSPTFTVSEAGRYRISVVFVNTCTEFFYFDVFKNTLDPTLTKRDIICGEPGFVQVENVPATGYEFATNIAGPYNPLDVFNANASIATQGEVTVYIRQVQTGTLPVICTFEERITVFAIDTDIVVSTTSPSCPPDNGTSSLGTISIEIQSPGNNVDPPYSFTITNGAFTSTQTPNATSIVFEDLNPGTYTIEATSFDGRCVDMGSAIIQDPPVFEAVATRRRDLSCERAEILITLTHPGFTGPYSFSLDDFVTTLVPGDLGNPDSNPPNYFVANADGTYSVFVDSDGSYTIYIDHNASGCQISTNEITVNPYTPLAFGLTPTPPNCAGESTGTIAVNVTSGQGAFTYVLYSRTPGALIIPPLPPTTPPAPPAPTNEPDVLTELITNNTADLGFTFMGLSSGMYSVGVRDVFGCEEPVAVDLTDPDALAGTASVTQEFNCDQEATITIVTTVGSGTAPYTYSIDGVTFISNGGVFPNLRDGTYNTLRIRDDNGCIFDITPAITIDPLEEITDLTIVPGDTVCNGTPSSTDVTVSVANILNPPIDLTTIQYRISASVPATTPSSVTTFSTTTVYTLQQGVTYTFEARTTADNCIYSEDYFVQPVVPASVTTELVSDVSCRGGNDGSFNFTVTDAATFTYTITGGPTAVPGGSGTGATAIPITGLLAGTYTVNITDSVTGCTDNAPITINEPAVGLGISALETTAATCAVGAEVTLTITGGTEPYRYQFVTGAGPAIPADYVNFDPANPIAFDIVAGSYTIYAIDANDCPANTTITLDAPLMLGATVTGDFCYDTVDQASLQITLTNATDPVSYTVNGGGTQNVPAGTNPFTVPNLIPGTYDIVVTDVRACSVTIPTQTIAPQLTLDATLTKDLDCIGDATFDITATGGYPGYTYGVSTNGGTSFTPITLPFTTNTAGTYLFEVVDTSSTLTNGTVNCSARSQEIIVTPLTTPTGTEVVTDIRCFGDGNGAVTITAADGIPPYMYELSSAPAGYTGPTGPQSSPVFSNLIGGDYEYTITDEKSCPSLPIAFTVDSPDEILGTEDITPITCGPTGNINGSIVFENVTGGTGNYTYTLLDTSNNIATDAVGVPVPVVGPTAATTVTFGNLGFGDYFVSVVDMRGCTKLFGPYRVATTPFFTVTSMASATCADGVISNIMITDGEGPFEIRILPSGAFISVNGEPLPTTTNMFGNTTNHQFNNNPASGGPLQVGVPYRFEILDTASGCTFIEEIDPVTPPGFTITATGIDEMCTADNDGNVTFTVTDYQGNELSWQVFDAITLAPIPGATGSQPVPPGGGVGSGSMQTIITTFPAGTLGTGDYFIQVTETGVGVLDPCNNSATFRIEEPLPLGIEEVSRVEADCDGNATVTVRGIDGTPPFTYQEVEDGQPEPITFTRGDAIELDPNTNVNWDIWVQDANGCTEKLDVDGLIPYVNPTLLAVVADECMINPDGTLTVNVSIPVPPTPSGTTFQFSRDGVSYEPNPGTATTTYSFDVLPGTGQIFYVRDNNGCIAESLPIDVLPALQLSAVFSEPSCNNADGSITVTSSGGSGVVNHTYQLLDATGTTPIGAPVVFNAGTNAFDFVTTGDYIVRVTDSGISNGTGDCTEDFPISVAPAVLPDLSLIKTDASCTATSSPTPGTDDEDGTITASLVAGSDTEPGTTGYQYELFAGGGLPNPIPVATIPLQGPQANPQFTGLAPGTYTVRVTSGRGCTDQDEIVIDPPTDLTLDNPVLTTDFSCAIDNSTEQAVITVTVNGTNIGTPGTPPAAVYSFSIDSDTDAVDTSDNFFPANGTGGNSHDFTISPITAPTTYTFTVRDSKGCEAIETLVVQPIRKPMATITPDLPFSCNNGEQITITADNGDTVNPGDYTFDLIPENTSTVPVPNDYQVATGPNPVSVTYDLPDPGTTYSIKVTDNTTGCFVIESHTTAPLDPIDAVVTEGTPVVCFNDTGSINLDVTGFTGSFTYITNGPTVVGPITATAPTAATINIPGLVGGNYTVTISRGTNMSTSCNFTTGTVPVRSPDDALTLTATQVQDLGCDPDNNASIQATATGGYGDYEYQLEKPAGTPFTNANATPTTYTYSTTNFFTDLEAGLYTILVRDKEGCVAPPVTVDILPPTIPVVTNPADMTVNCFGDVDGSATVMATGGQGAGSYIFTLIFPTTGNPTQQELDTDADGQHTFTGLIPGSYTGTVTDNLGCAAPFTFMINEPTEVTVAIATSGTLTCLIPETVTVTGMGGTGSHEFGISVNGGPITYSSSSTFDIYADAALGTYGPGDYTFYVRDTPNGCESNVSNQVRILPFPELTLDLDLADAVEVKCSGETTASVSSTVTGGIGGYTFTLVNSTSGRTRTGGAIDDDTNDYRFPGTFTNLEGGDYTYRVTSGTIADEDDCGLLEEMFTVAEPPIVEAEITPFDVTCGGLEDDEKDGRIVIVASGGRGEFIYSIQGPETRPFQDAGPANANPETYEFISLLPGTYTVTVQDKNGCLYVEEVEIGEPDELEVDDPVETDRISCAGETTASVTVTIRGGTQPYMIRVNNDPFQPVPVPADPMGDHVMVFPNLPGNTPYQYTIMDSRGCTLPPAFIVTSPGLSATATLITTCSVVDNMTAISNDIEIIVPESLRQTRPDLTDDLYYFLTDSDTGTELESRQPMFSNVGPGMYTVSVRNGPAPNCRHTLDDIIEIADYEPLVITAVVPTGNLNEWRVIVDGGVPFDTTSGGNPYRIYVDGNLLEGENGNTFTIESTRVYNFRVEDSATSNDGGSCPVETAIELEFVNLFIPNYFTPDGDGTYDTWYPENTEFFPDIKVRVFDRYGRLLQQFKGPVAGWDGKYQDKLLPSGDYWYLIDLNDGERDRQFTGHFTLYR